MSFFRFLWLRRLIRQNTAPIPINKAEKWKNRLSFAYMFLGWNAFGFVCYMCFTGKSDWARYHGVKSEDEAKMPPGQAWAQTLGIQNIEVYKYSGISKKGKYKIEEGEIKESNP